MSRIKLQILSLVLLSFGLQGGSFAADSEAAEHQFRVARRLIADGAPNADAALAKVLELDPQGPLADDALIEQALLLGVAGWPEELGRISSTAAVRATTLVKQVVDEFSSADRVDEARYILALLLLEPLAQRDQQAAKMEVIHLTTAVQDTEWSRRGRYAGAWLAARRSQQDRARSAFERLYVDNPRGEVAARARVGRAQLALIDGDHGLAAQLLQEAIDAGVPAEVGAEPLRVLAVQNLLDGKGVGPPTVTNTGIRSISGLSPTPSGGLLLGDHKNDQVLELDSQGQKVGSWPLEDVDALCVTLPGRIFAATDVSIYSLIRGKAPLIVAELADFASVRGMTGDDTGRIWVLDRQGARIGVLVPGAPKPIPIYEGSRLSSIVWDGRRLIAVNEKEKSLIAITPEGRVQSIGGKELQKPISVTADRTGRLAVLDSRAGNIYFLQADGSLIRSVDYQTIGIKSPSVPVFGADGQLNILDESNGSWITMP